MRNYPLVTVLIATYNYEQYIGVAIESVINQEYPADKIEIIVVDDGSKDHTNGVVKAYQYKINVSYTYQENKGKASATKLGIEKAKGKYIFVLDADDYYLPDCLDIVVSYFEKDDSVVQVSHLAKRLEKNSYYEQKLTNKLSNIAVDGIKMLKGCLFKGWNVGLGSTFAAKTSVLKDINIPNEVDMYIDFYLLFAIATKGKIIQLDKYLSVFRRHEKAYSEGNIRVEDKKTRALRYLKSAHAVYRFNFMNFKQVSIRFYLKYFYYDHLLHSKKFTHISFLSFLEYLKSTFIIFFFSKNKVRLIKQSIKTILF